MEEPTTEEPATEERLVDDPAIARAVEQLRSIEESLRDLAYDRLTETVAEGGQRVSQPQRKIEQARRGVARALRALDPDSAL